MTRAAPGCSRRARETALRVSRSAAVVTVHELTTTKLCASDRRAAISSVSAAFVRQPRLMKVMVCEWLKVTNEPRQPSPQCPGWDSAYPEWLRERGYGAGPRGPYVGTRGVGPSLARACGQRRAVALEAAGAQGAGVRPRASTARSPAGARSGDGAGQARTPVGGGGLRGVRSRRKQVGSEGDLCGGRCGRPPRRPRRRDLPAVAVSVCLLRLRAG